MITEKITSENDMTAGQRKQIKRFLEDAFTSLDIDALLNSLGLTKETAQAVIEKGNMVKQQLEKDVTALLKKNAVIDKRIGAAMTEFELTVPSDYNHDKQIDQSAKKAKKEKTTYYYNDALTSKNYAKATNKLEPGKTYKVKLFPILSNISSDDCMAFLRKQNAILTGGQGATLLYDLHKDQLPKGKWAISFDEKDALWEDADGHRRVPYVSARTDGGFRFYLAYWLGDWGSVGVLVCFCDMTASA